MPFSPWKPAPHRNARRRLDPFSCSAFGRVGDITFEYLRRLGDFMTVEEDAIRYWTQWLQHLLKITVEPSSAVAMAGVARSLMGKGGRRRVLVILSGGNVDQAKMCRVWQEDCLSRIPSIGEAEYR